MRNAYDEKYDIRRAYYEEIDEIMTFIDTYWKKGHILAVNRAFFEYEMVVDGEVNFVVAKEKNSSEIVGLHGYIMASKNHNKFDTWGSIWVVKPGVMALLGLEVVLRLEEIIGTRAFLSIGGNSQTTVPILKHIRKFKDVGVMKHYYCLSHRETYNIAVINHYEKLRTNNHFQVEYTLLPHFSDVEKNFILSYCDYEYPVKDYWYIKHRYYDHPAFDYKVFGLYDSGCVSGLLVCREQLYKGDKALRIVDYIGKLSLLGGISNFLRRQLMDNDYEYIDMYCYGVPEDYLLMSGMIERKKNDSNIIPNYFSPFVQSNIDIWVGAPEGNAVFFKADGDQDRPN